MLAVLKSPRAKNNGELYSSTCDLRRDLGKLAFQRIQTLLECTDSRRNSELGMRLQITASAYNVKHGKFLRDLFLALPALGSEKVPKNA